MQTQMRKDWFRRGIEYCRGGVFDLSNLQTKYFPDVSGGSMFAYLYRRFGPPLAGCDEYKTLAQYVLTTDHPEIYLTVTIFAVDFCFGYGLSRAIEQRLFEEERRLPEAEVAKAERAILEAAILELRRPTYVRDEYFNPGGACPPGDDPVEYFDASKRKR